MRCHRKPLLLAALTLLILPEGSQATTRSQSCSAFDFIRSYGPHEPQSPTSFVMGRWFPYARKTAPTTTESVKGAEAAFDFEFFLSDFTTIRDSFSPKGIKRTTNPDSQVFAWLDEQTYVLKTGKSEWQDGGLPLTLPDWEPDFLWTTVENHSDPSIGIYRVSSTSDTQLWQSGNNQVSAPQRLLNIDGVPSDPR